MSRIEFQKTVDEIDCLRANILKEMAGRHLLYLHQFQLIRALRAFKRVKIVLTRTTCKGNNFLNLLRSWFAWEHRLPRKHFGHNTAKTPNIRFHWVLVAAENDFGWPVPSCCHELCHVELLSCLCAHKARKAEITKLDCTIRVNENISRLQIPMYNFRLMQKFQCLCNLARNKPHMSFFKEFLFNDAVEIALHVVEDKINVSIVVCSNDLSKVDQIGMVLQFPQDAYFSVCSLSILNISKGIKDFLESQCFFRLAIEHFPDVSVRSTSHLLDEFIFFQDVVFDFLLTIHFHQ